MTNEQRLFCSSAVHINVITFAQQLFWMDHSLPQACKGRELILNNPRDFPQSTCTAVRTIGFLVFQQKMDHLQCNYFYSMAVDWVNVVLFPWQGSKRFLAQTWPRDVKIMSVETKFFLLSNFSFCGSFLLSSSRQTNWLSPVVKVWVVYTWAFLIELTALSTKWGSK